MFMNKSGWTKQHAYYDQSVGILNQSGTVKLDFSLVPRG